MLYAKQSPFFFPLLCLCIGIYVQSTAIFSMTLLFTGWCVITVLIVGRMVRYDFASAKSLTTNGILIPLLFFFTGALLLQAQRDWQKILLQTYANKPIDIVGVIDDITDRAASDYGQIIRIRISDVHDQVTGQDQKVDFKLVMYTTGRLKGLKVDDVVAFQNISFSGSTSERMTNNPSFQDYLLKEHIIGSVFIYGRINYGLIARPTYSLARWLWHLRESTYHGLKKKLSAKTFQYVALIFLGNKHQENSEALRQTFSYWGLSHYLARAGLHIVLFILVWQFLLNLLPIHLLFKRLLLIVMCIIYGLLSWYSIPFGRALYSFLLAEGGRSFGLQPTFFHTLTLLCCVMLLFSPMQLFFLDFQLTFGLTFILSWYGRFTAPNIQES